jgi:hypothetical protein
MNEHATTVKIEKIPIVIVKPEVPKKPLLWQSGKLFEGRN